MTREEEYTQAASDYILSQVVPVGNEKLAYGDFINGMKWADKHPKEGLWDAEKVIKWILENADKHIWYDETENECGITDNFIEDLQKAMKEE